MGNGASSTVNTGVLRASLAIKRQITTLTQSKPQKELAKVDQRRKNHRQTTIILPEDRNKASKRDSSKKQNYSFNNQVFADSFAKLQQAWEVDRNLGHGKPSGGEDTAGTPTRDTDHADDLTLQPSDPSKPVLRHYPFSEFAVELLQKKVARTPTTDLDTWVEEEIVKAVREEDKVLESLCQREREIDKDNESQTQWSPKPTENEDEAATFQPTEAALEEAIQENLNALRLQQQRGDDAGVLRMLQYDITPLYAELRERYGVSAVRKLADSTGSVDLVKFDLRLEQAALENQRVLTDVEKFFLVLTAKNLNVEETVQALISSNWDIDKLLASAEFKEDSTIPSREDPAADLVARSILAVKAHDIVTLRQLAGRIEPADALRCLAIGLFSPDGINRPICDILLGKVNNKDLQRLFIQCAMANQPGPVRYMYATVKIEKVSLGKAIQAAVLKRSTSVLDALLPFATDKSTEIDIAVQLAAKHGNIPALRLLLPKASQYAQLTGYKMAKGNCAEPVIRARIMRERLYNNNRWRNNCH